MNGEVTMSFELSDFEETSHIIKLNICSPGLNKKPLRTLTIKYTKGKFKEYYCVPPQDKNHSADLELKLVQQ